MPTDMHRLRSRLLEAVVWCSRETWPGDPALALRTDTLRPLGRVDPASRDWGSHTNWESIVGQIARKRRQELKNRQIALSIVKLNNAKGRLLAYDPSGSLADGSACLASQGFLDEENAPPWDTWVSYVRLAPSDTPIWSIFQDYLIAWIPAEYSHLVSAAIAVNVEDCIKWVSDLNDTFAQQLRTDHLEHLL